MALVENRQWYEAQARDVQRAVMAGVIQNFEIVFELSIKMVRRFLEKISDAPMRTDALTYRGLLREAGERDMVEDVEAWFEYRRLRNITVHTYDEVKAAEVYAGLSRFLTDAKSLLATMESRGD